MSTFGVINGTALDYFARVEESAAAKGMPFVPERAGPKSLCQLASLVTILEVASIVVSAHTQGAGANEADSLVAAEAAGGPGGGRVKRVRPHTRPRGELTERRD